LILGSIMLQFLHFNLETADHKNIHMSFNKLFS